MENSNKVVFIADMESDPFMQKNLIDLLSKLFNCYLIWNAKGTCSQSCHPMKEIDDKTIDKTIDLGHLDLKMFDEIIKVVGHKTENIIVISVNEVLSAFKEYPLILMNLPSTSSHSLVDKLDVVSEFANSISQFKKALILFNINDALISIKEFKQLFNFYEIINLDFDQISNRVHFPKVEMHKLLSLIKNIR